MEATAKLCSVCKSYRSAWRNWLPHIGVILSVVTFILSGATFVVTNLMSYWKASHSVDRVSIVDLDTPHALLLSNVGDNDAFVTEVEVHCPEIGYLQQYRLIQKCACAADHRD